MHPRIHAAERAGLFVCSCLVMCASLRFATLSLCLLDTHTHTTHNTHTHTHTPASCDIRAYWALQKASMPPPHALPLVVSYYLLSYQFVSNRIIYIRHNMDYIRHIILYCDIMLLHYLHTIYIHFLMFLSKLAQALPQFAGEALPCPDRLRASFCTCYYATSLSLGYEIKYL